MRPNESTYQFLDRSARQLFGEVRRLLNQWVAALPEEVQGDLVPRLRSDDQGVFESAFWELYLYTAYVRSGHRVTVHPDVPGTANHPDFLVEGNGARFYLEAVRVGTTPADAAAERRLQEVKAALARLRADRFVISLLHRTVGHNSLPTRRLRDELVSWLDGLDPAAVHEDLSHGSTFDRAPKLSLSHEGWELEFQAIPLPDEALGHDQSLLGVSGPAEAQWVNNQSGVLRVLDSKAHRYGALDHPLVIAVMSNTEYRTEDYEFEQALFGRAVGGRLEAIRDPRRVVEGGHWLTSQGWRRGHAPHVIAASDLKPWSITRTHPRLWTTLETDVVVPPQPDWLSRVNIGSHVPSVEAIDVASLEALFGLPPGWGEYES